MEKYMESRTINWDKIIRKYPQAFHLCHEYLWGDCAYEFGKYPPIVLKDFKTKVNVRELYDFFDALGIFITINYDSPRFSYKISYDDGSEEIKSNDLVLFRINAEIDAFEYAFFILEKRQLKKRFILSPRLSNK